MPSAYFQIQLTVQPQSGGSAILEPPAVLKSTHYSFVTVKEGGGEAIVKVDGPDSVLKQVEKDKGCKKLTVKQLETLKESYPRPKLKKKFRSQPQPRDADAAAPAAMGMSAVDEKGERVVDTFQTVRSGFHLIDVPILTEPPEKARE